MFKTENKLKELFEFARFVEDPKIGKLAEETLAKYPEELSDDALSAVSAAGDPFETPRDEEQRR